MVEPKVVNSNDKWDMDETRRLVELNFGVAQRESFNSYTKPFNHRFYHSQYHFQEIQRLLREAIDEKLVEKDIIEILLMEFNTSQQSFIKIEAHIIACAQSIHSVTDIFAHAVYFALGLNLNKESSLKGKQINFKNVIDKITEEKFFEVRRIMTQLLESDLYNLLENIVIQGKHRGLPEPTIAVKSEENEIPYNLQFSAFTFGDKLQIEREFQELLSPIYAETSQMVVQTGILINEALSI